MGEQCEKEQQTLNLYRRLTEAPGVPGHEAPVRHIMSELMAPYADELTVDNLGSLIARKQGEANGPRIMLAGHMDEVGFMVTRITEGGFLKFLPLGGWWNQVMLAQRVRVLTRKGELMGVIGSKPPHVLPAEERKKPVKIEDMFIDVGALSKEEAESFGIRPGDSVVPDCPFTEMANPKMLMAKAWDNRFGCIVALEVLRQLHEQQHPNTVFSVATVQEEVGLRGAQTSVHTVKPDIAFAIDVGIDGSTPGMKPDDSQGEIGKGPQITLYDATMIAHRGLREFVIETAESEGIPYQFEAMPGGGTDAGRFFLHGQGVPSLAICVPTRYIHSHASIIHRDDIDHTVRLLVALIKKMDRQAVDHIMNNPH
ncbi:M42 family metallopeptidase [Numidum massiliense]|uniref:M42 family metallopeptidase n=1 Tax=Numidum massiliense TaxID=1522315 RepID=UPI0006D57FF0|nr:M42 family metallopeptidase [Numidum massiliense]